MVFATLLLICYTFLMYYGIRDENTRLKIAAFFCLGISALMATVIGMINFFSRPDKYTPFKDMVRKTLSTYFDRLNRKYDPRGLEWYVHDNHFWIEVRINV